MSGTLTRFTKAGAGAAFFCAGLLFAAGVDVHPQAKTKSAKRKPIKAAAKPADEPQVPPAVPSVTQVVKDETKKNSRPGETPPVRETPTADAAGQQRPPEYTYVFSRPGFTYERMVIEHDDSGKGTFTLKKLDYAEEVSDPVMLSAKTMSKLRTAFDVLDFLNSAENYQVSRDYSHMGTIELTLRRDGRERTARYNWTDNKQAKALMEEYRRISNEYAWRFEMSLARENQPLQTPGLMNVIESHVKRNEISDPKGLIPYLNDLASDERLPLIARNKAGELVRHIEKMK